MSQPGLWLHFKGVENPSVKKVTETVKSKKIRDTNYDKNKRVREWDPRWATDYPWVECDAVNNIMHCRVCREHKDLSDPSSAYVQSAGCSNFSTTSLNQHQKSKRHEKAANRERERQRKRKIDQVDVPVSESTDDTPDDADRALDMLNVSVASRVQHLVRNAHAIARNARPYTDFVWMCELDRSKGLDIGFTYQTDKYCRVFQSSIAEVERQKLVEKVANCKFLSIMVDGSTDTSVQEQELLYVRTVEMGEPQMTFVSIESVEKSDAPSVLRAIENAMETLVDKEWKNKLVGLTTDGAAVMVGKNAGLAALLKRERPDLVTLHCTAHRLELAVKSMAKCVPWFSKVDRLILNIYLFYHNSALNRSNLKNSCSAAGVKFLTPTRVGGTRWVNHTLRALTSLLRIYPGLIMHLDQVI
jgi:hypothetical protein